MAGRKNYADTLAKWMLSGGSQKDFDLLEVTREIIQATADGKLNAQMFDDALDDAIGESGEKVKAADQPARVWKLFKRMMNQLLADDDE